MQYACRFVSVAVALLLPAVVAAQPTGYAEANRAAKSILESVPVPVFSAGKQLAVTATYAVSSPAVCELLVVASIPPWRSGNVLHPASAERTLLRWGTPMTLILDQIKPNIKVHARGIPEGRSFHSGSAAANARLMRAFNTMQSYCTAPGLTSTAPGSFAQRTAIPPDVIGTPQCRFSAIPELLLLDRRAPSVKGYRFEVRPRQAREPKTRMTVSGQIGDKVSAWGGVLGSASFEIVNPEHSKQQLTGGRILVDGRDLGIPLRVNHSKLWSGKGFSDYVGLGVGNYSNSSAFVGGIGRGKLLVVELSDARGNVRSRASFDVGRLRYVPRALEDAGWACPQYKG